MRGSMVDIQPATAEIRRGIKEEEEERNYRMKIYMVCLLHRATIINVIFGGNWPTKVQQIRMKDTLLLVCFFPISNPLRTKTKSTFQTGIKLVGYYNSPPQPFHGPFSGTTLVSRCQERTS